MLVLSPEKMPSGGKKREELDGPSVPFTSDNQENANQIVSGAGGTTGADSLNCCELTMGVMQKGKQLREPKRRSHLKS